jgi:CDP-6-deoxy-D-xylo-4-hexulose-3-dehydrase
MPDSPFLTDFRELLAKHNISAPRFAHGAAAFNPAKPQCLYSGPIYDEDELVAGVGALVEGKWAVAGEHVARFERLFSTYLSQKGSVMVNSGSSADLLAVAAMKARYGWKDGEGIIVSPAGFPTTISAITLNGLTPVFVDIEWETLNADNDGIEEVLRRSEEMRKWSWFEPGYPIRAILISPVLGNPPDMDRLTALAARFGVKLLLDGCDSLGSTWRGKPLAQYADVSTCSFFPSHHISTLQGGMISSDDEELLRLARSMSAWGKDCDCVGAGNMLPNGCCGKRFSCWLPSCPDVVVDHRYVYSTAQAYNLQPIDLQGALGCAQMDKMDTIHFARKEAHHRIARMVWQHLKGGVKTAVALPEASPSWFGFPFICPSYVYKQALVTHLEAAGIQTRNYFAGTVTAQPGYAHLGNPADQPNANEVLKKVFFIGTNPGWSQAHFGHIEKTLASFVPPIS